MVFYRLLLGLLSPLLLVVLIRESRRRQGGGRFFRERFGLISAAPKPCSVWIHAASVGEVMAALPLLEAASASHGMLVTTNTPEAARLLASEFGSRISHCYCPLDFAWAIRRLINRYQPRQLFVMETELWPNLFHVAATRGLAPIIVNGRLSASTLEAPKPVRVLYRSVLRHVAAVWARSDADARGFQGLGCDAAKIAVLGNIKYGRAVTAAAPTRPAELVGRSYVLAASTHEGEEEQLADIWRGLDAPPLLVLLPRHPSRGSAIVTSLRGSGFAVSQRSCGDAITHATQIYVADTIGELLQFAEGAQWVFMGGSLITGGGHNLLEPAALGKAVVTGQHLSNFREEADFLSGHSALLTVKDADELRHLAERLLANPDEVADLGHRARGAMSETGDVTERYLSLFRVRLEQLAEASP